MTSSYRKFTKRIVLGLLAVAVISSSAIWGVAEWLLRRKHAVPVQSLPTQGTMVDPVEGRRMAILVGCLEGCHGREGEGGSEGAPGIFNASAPPLPSVLPLYSDAQLVRLVRFGVKRDGRAALGMPSATFYPLADEDLRNIIAHLRQRPDVPARPSSREVTLLGRLGLVLGKWRTSADAVDASKPRWGDSIRITPFERGRYVASVICTECHGPDFQGDEFMNSPPLTVVRGYTIEQFKHLMRTGEPISRRDLGIMSTVAQRAFVHFKSNELEDLYTYLTTRPSSPVGRRDAAY